MVFMASASPAHARSYVIRVAGGTYQVGPFKVRGVFTDPRATLAGADQEFGAADHCRLHGFPTDATASWPAWGITGEFLTLGGFATADENACANKAQVRVGTLVASGRRWHTTAGLHVGDSLSRLRRLYPLASERPDGWWLHTIRVPAANFDRIGDLVANIRHRTVRSLIISIGAEGD